MSAELNIYGKIRVGRLVELKILQSQRVYLNKQIFLFILPI